MHDDRKEVLRHDHNYLGRGHARNETAARWVMVITFTMMTVEITAGVIYGSMALLADGWHMASHAAALGIAAFAYMYARRNRDNDRFSFGTGKVGDLAGFSSALLLGVVAVLMAWESAQRLLNPVQIDFAQATLVAVVGLMVNILCAWLLRDDHHQHHHDDDHDHHHAHHSDDDHNMRAAYLHVLADALTSLLAITALLGGQFLGWSWLDPVMGLVGAVVISRWAWGLMSDTASVLLDAEPAPGLAANVKSLLESEADNRVADLHIWRIGPGHSALIATVVTRTPRPPSHYKSLMASVRGLSHVTIEVESCSPSATGHANAV
jgi:cation diffusion facilitator family transporter